MKDADRKTNVFILRKKSTASSLHWEKNVRLKYDRLTSLLLVARQHFRDWLVRWFQNRKYIYVRFVGSCPNCGDGPWSTSDFGTYRPFEKETFAYL